MSVPHDAKRMRWVPLESNPELFSTYTSSLGLDTSKASFVDVFGFDEELLSFVPQPVYATVLLFPVTEGLEKQRAEQAKLPPIDAPDLIYMRQTIGNACGTMGLLHAIANSPAPLVAGSPLESIFQRAKGKSPEESARILENDAALEQAHTTAAAGGQTAAPAADAKIDLHFCAFVDHHGRLIELDGRKKGPVDHGPIQKDLLRDSVRLTQDFMALAPGAYEFSLCALVGQAS